MKVAELQMHRSGSSPGVKPTEHAGHLQQNRQPEKPSKPFANLVGEKIEAQKQVRFSAHAMERLANRSIILTQADLDRLNSGVKTIAERGGRSSLIMMDETAYVVSIKNRTVITALSGDMIRDNVFTNIDSAAIV